MFREWLAGVGRRTAKTRIAHLICEVFLRLRALGQADDGGFELPITQIELADALGLSPVHVNRVLHELRADGLIASRGRFVIISELQRLQAAGDFDATYLHLRKDAA